MKGDIEDEEMDEADGNNSRYDALTKRNNDDREHCDALLTFSNLPNPPKAFQSNGQKPKTVFCCMEK